MTDYEHPYNALPPGYRLQEYELVRVLGDGGFGITYLGFDDHLDKAVAIKEYLPSDFAIRTDNHRVKPKASTYHKDFMWGLDRFLDEAKTLARFDHRHIVKVHRRFEAHGTAYIVMEYAEGEPLSKYLERKGTLEEAELKGILYPLLSALEVVHGADFLHRDITPNNIMLRDEDSSPVLIDFGTARQAMGERRRSSKAIWTRGYAPIEQYSSVSNQGAWTDLYALGAVCYRALTGQVPIEASERVRRDSLEPIGELCGGRVSAGFLSAVEWALQVEEDARPRSVTVWRAVLEADGEEAQEQTVDLRPLEDLAAGSEQQNKPLKPRQRRHRSRRRSRVRLHFKRLAVVLGIVAVLLVGGKMYIDYAEQAALEQQRQEQAALEKQRREQAALDKQRQNQVFVAEVGREPSPDAVDDKGKTDLHHAARLNLPVLTLLLIKQGAAVDARDKYGRTPLFSAAEAGAFSVAELLLKQGADVNARNNFGYTPLFSAAEAGAFSVAELLLKQGADVNAKGTYGWTSLHMAARAGAFSVAELLIRYGADVNAKRKDVGGTPLHIVSHNMHRVPFSNASSVAELLLKQGADVNAKNYRSETPLHNAATRKDISVAEVLIRYGADVNAKDKNGWTPLHDAGWQRASSVAELLLRQGADVNAKDNDGKTPLRSAVEWDKPKIAELLRRYGGRE